MAIPADEFKKKFPNLAKEVEQSGMSITIDSVRTEVSEEDEKDPLRGYSPDVIDFLRRCSKLEEAEEIISFLEKRGEVSHIQAKKIRDQLNKKGLRSFGTKKEDGHYFKESKT